MRFSPAQKKIAWGVGITAGVSAIVTAIAVASKKEETVLDLQKKSTAQDKVDVNTLITLERFMAAAEILGPFQVQVSTGTCVVVNRQAFESIYRHASFAPSRTNGLLQTVASIFFNSNGAFSFDKIASQSSCQSSAAEIVNWGNAFYDFYFTHSCYQIDPHANPGTFNDCINQTIAKVVDLAADQASLSALFQKASTASSGTVKPPAGFDQGDLYVIPVDGETFAILSKLANEMNKNTKHVDLVFVDDVTKAPVPEPYQSLLRASVGAAIVASMIDRFESHDPKQNPCIRELDAGTVFQMFSVTIGTVLGLAFGPALSAVSTIIKIADTIQKLAALSR